MNVSTLDIIQLYAIPMQTVSISQTQNMDAGDSVLLYKKKKVKRIMFLRIAQKLSNA